MLYSCTHVSAVGIKGLRIYSLTHSLTDSLPSWMTMPNAWTAWTFQI